MNIGCMTPHHETIPQHLHYGAPTKEVDPETREDKFEYSKGPHRSRNADGRWRQKRADTHLMTLAEHYREFGHLVNMGTAGMHLGAIRGIVDRVALIDVRKEAKKLKGL